MFNLLVLSDKAAIVPEAGLADHVKLSLSMHRRKLEPRASINESGRIQPDTKFI